jgi:hypothetical protein
VLDGTLEAAPVDPPFSIACTEGRGQPPLGPLLGLGDSPSLLIDRRCAWHGPTGVNAKIYGPPGRTLATIWYDPLGRSIYFASGETGVAVQYNDFYRLDLAPHVEWTALATKNAFPSPRVGACGVVDPIARRLVLFGGAIDWPPPDACCNEVWTYDLDVPTSGWNLLSLDDAPAQRMMAACTYDPMRNRMLVYGGSSTGGTGVATSLIALDLTLGQEHWETIETSAAPPGKTHRLWHALAYDRRRDRLLLIGGSEPWTWPGVAFGDVWSLSLESPQAGWKMLAIVGEVPGNSIAGAEAFYEPLSDTLILHAGSIWNDPISYGDIPPDDQLYSSWSLEFYGSDGGNWNEIRTARAMGFAVYAPIHWDPYLARGWQILGERHTSKITTNWVPPYYRTEIRSVVLEGASP